MTETEPQFNGVRSLRQICSSLHARVEAFLAEDAPTEVLRQTQQQVRASLAVIQEALKRYELRELSLSYNGGKDCLVLLVLYLASLASLPSLPASLESIYIVSSHPFAEVDAFVDASSYAYHLSLLRLARPSMKDAFAEYLAQRKETKAIFVGTRRTDPHGGSLTNFDMTDGGWPSFMRIHPVIDWHYAEIWAFIRHLKIPYCELYDRGYTSLGGTEDTHPNPLLKVNDGGKEAEDAGFMPAYKLVGDDEERLGRDH